MFYLGVFLPDTSGQAVRQDKRPQVSGRRSFIHLRLRAEADVTRLVDSVKPRVKLVYDYRIVQHPCCPSNQGNA